MDPKKRNKVDEALPEEDLEVVSLDLINIETDPKANKDTHKTYCYGRDCYDCPY